MDYVSIEMIIRNLRNPPKTLTIAHMREYAKFKSIHIPSKYRKQEIFDLLKASTTENNLLNLYHIENYDEEMVEKILDQLEEAPYMDCSWFNNFNLLKISDKVYRDDNRIYKISQYHEKVNFLTVLYASTVNKIASPVLSKVEFIRACDQLPGVFPGHNLIVEISEYYSGIELEEATFSLDVHIVKSLFAQVIVGVYQLGIHKCLHLDLHDQNVIVVPTKQKDLVSELGIIPTFGYEAKIIDYDRVGMVFGQTLFTSFFPDIEVIPGIKKPGVPSIHNTGYNFYDGYIIRKFPVYGILHSLFRLLSFSNPASDAVNETSIYLLLNYLNTFYGPQPDNLELFLSPGYHNFKDVFDSLKDGLIEMVDVLIQA